MFLYSFFLRDNYRQQQPKPHPIRKVSFQIVCYVVSYLLLAADVDDDNDGENDFQRTFFGWHVCFRIFDILKCVSRQCQKKSDASKIGETLTTITSPNRLWAYIFVFGTL